MTSHLRDFLVPELIAERSPIQNYDNFEEYVQQNDETRVEGDETLRYGAMWILRSSEPDGSLTFRLGPGAIKTVGRAPRADFIIDAALVSRLHCRLEAGDARLDVIDLESTNGTFVNDARVVDRAKLAEGDRLRVGRVELTVIRDDDHST
jgi:FHA domain